MTDVTPEPGTQAGRELTTWMRGYGIAELRVKAILAIEEQAVANFTASLIGVKTIVSIASQRQLVAEAEATTALRQEIERLTRMVSPDRVALVLSRYHIIGGVEREDFIAGLNGWAPDGHPWPEIEEPERQQMYAELLASGLSESEAAGTVWPQEPTK